MIQIKCHDCNNIEMLLELKRSARMKSVAIRYEDNFPSFIFSVFCCVHLWKSAIWFVCQTLMWMSGNMNTARMHQSCVCRFVCITLTNQHVYCTQSDKANKHFLWYDADDVVDSHSISPCLQLVLSIQSSIYCKSSLLFNSDFHFMCI